MTGFWMANYNPPPANRSGADSVNATVRIAELEHQVSRLLLLNQALWEVLKPRIKMTDAEFEQIVRNVDLRDGVEDGKITHNAVKCPQCSRVSNSKHYKCLYCGLEFEKPMFG